MNFIALSATALVASLSTAAFAQDTTPKFQDTSLAFAADVYTRLKEEAPANREYILKLTVSGVNGLSQRNLTTAVKSAIREAICTENIYACPSTFSLRAQTGRSYEAVAPSVQNALASVRPLARTSEHFFDLTTGLTDLADKTSGAVLYLGSESNPFGASELVVAVSKGTDEVLVIGSGYAE